MRDLFYLFIVEEEAEEKLSRTRGDTVELLPTGKNKSKNRNSSAQMDVEAEDSDSGDSVVVYETKID